MAQWSRRRTSIQQIWVQLPLVPVLEETTGTADDLAEDGAERSRLPRAVMDRRSAVLEETTRMTMDDLDEDGAELPRLPWDVMDRRSRPGPEPTTLEAVGDQWRYALIVVQAEGDDGDVNDDDDDGTHMSHWWRQEGHLAKTAPMRQ